MVRRSTGSVLVNKRMQNMKQGIRISAVIVLMVGLAACSVLPKSDPLPIDHYTLDVTLPAPAMETASKTVAAPVALPVLLIAPPQTRADLRTPRMAYRERDYDISYFGRSRWADTPAELLLPGLMEAFDASGQYRVVLNSVTPVSPDLRLDSKLLEFSQDFRVTPSVFQLRLRVQLVDVKQRRVLASRIFEAGHPAPAASPYGGVQAANRAWQTLLPEIVAFCVTHTHTP